MKKTLGMMIAELRKKGYDATGIGRKNGRDG